MAAISDRAGGGTTSATKLILSIGTALAASLVLVALILGGAGAQQPIDLSGEWDIEIEGSLALTCTATFTQDATSLTLDSECSLIGPTTFSGSIDPESGVFSLEGSVFGFGVTLEGTASGDGDTISGTWAAEVLGFSGTLAGTRSGERGTPTPLPTLPAPVDLTGTWTVEFSGIFGGTCDSVIVQSGTELRSVAQCPLIGTVRPSGAIDPTTGAFSISDGAVELEGVAAADGNSSSGTWRALGLFSGTFTATRSVDVELIDVSGDWDAVLTGALKDTCALAIEMETLLDASATLACDGLGTGELTGTGNPLQGDASLSGSVDGLELTLYFRRAESGEYLTGYWFHDELDGTAIAVAAGGLDAGLVAVDCGQEQPGLQVSCAHNQGDTWSLAVSVVVPPPDGYSGFQVALRGLADPIVYSPAASAAEELAVGFCGQVARSLLEGGVTFLCQPSDPPSAESAAGDLLLLQVRCPGDGGAIIELAPHEADAGSYLMDLAGAPIDAYLIGATAECFAPQHSGPGPSAGDVDCDGEASSIDAALILQYEAGLVAALACQSQGDVSGDAELNSIDAALVLQGVAGLIDLS